MKKYILSIMIFSFGISDVANDLFIQGNQFIFDEKYIDAVQSFESILELGYENSDIYYNLGNSYFRIGDIGNSIWAYEKALELSPRDSDINFNIKYLRSMVRDKIIPPDDMYLISIYKSILLKFNLQDILSIIGFIFLILSLKYVLNNFSSILKPVNYLINFS